MELARYSNELQKNMYDHTFNKNTPVEQMKRLKEAGLSAELMYSGGSGGGGVSAVTGSANAGSVSGGQAATAAAKEAARIQNTMMGLEMQKLGAEVKVLEADAKQKEADAEKKSGVDTEVGLATLSKLKADTENVKMQTEIAEIEKSIQLLSGTDQVDVWHKQAQLIGEQV